MDGNTDSEFAFRRVTIGFDGTLGDVVTDYFSFDLEVSVLPEDLQACLPCIEVSEGFGESAAEGGVDHRCVIRKIGDGDRVGSLIVDVRAVHLIAYGAGLERK